ASVIGAIDDLRAKLLGFLPPVSASEVFVSPGRKPMSFGTWQEIPGGGRAGSGPAATLFERSLHVFVRGTNDRIYEQVRSATGAWGGVWKEVVGKGRPGLAASGLAAVVDYDGSLCLFVRGTTNRVYENIKGPGDDWRGWVEVPGQGLTFS